MPAAESAAHAFGEKAIRAVRLPVASAARKNSGRPSGTVMAIACPTVPVRTPRRTLALLKANVAAEQIASKAPNTPAIPFVMPRESGASSNLGLAIKRQAEDYWIIRFRG